VTRGKGVPLFGEHVDDLVPVYFAEITSLRRERLLEKSDYEYRRCNAGLQ
jgi:hypothetical protein